MKILPMLLVILMSSAALAEEKLTCFISTKAPQPAYGYGGTPIVGVYGQSLSEMEMVVATQTFPIVSLAPPRTIELASGKNRASVTFYAINKGVSDGKKVLKHGFTQLEMNLEVEGLQAPITLRKNLMANGIGFTETLSFQDLSLICTNRLIQNKFVAKP